MAGAILRLARQFPVLAMTGTALPQATGTLYRPWASVITAVSGVLPPSA